MTHLQTIRDGHWIFLASCLIAIAHKHLTSGEAIAANKHTYTHRMK